MKSLLLVVAACAALAAPVRALTPETASFLVKAGLDPTSADVRAADEEGPVTVLFQGEDKDFSLDSLATEGKKNGIKAFVAARAFIRRLKQNFAGTPAPKQGLDMLYLTLEERQLAMRKVFP